MRLAPVVPLLVLLAVCLPAGAAIDTIIPLPKEVRAVGEAVPLGGFRIVVAAGPRMRIAADEINERVVSLGRRALPVLELEDELPEGKLIVVAPCTTRTFGLEISPRDPGSQGYLIQPQGRRLFLIGSDTLGTLYAAVTCRQLIFRRDGTVFLQPAAVRDWPDYKHREHGMAFAEHLRDQWYSISSAERKGNLDKARELALGFVRVQKGYYDWMLRAKINLAWHSTNIKPGDAPPDTTAVRAALKEIHEYGLARGIDSMAGDTTAIGTYPKDKDNPGFSDIVRHRSHNRYFCWSRLDYHRRRAKRAAKWLAEAGYTGYYLHATDGGGWENPELWKDRCRLCRKTYGNDRAKADATVFRVYYDEIKRRIPTVKFVAVIYPYTGRYLDPDFVTQRAAAQMGAGPPAREVGLRISRELTEFIRRLDTMLPEDVYVCIRESERRHFDLARAAWGKRRFQLYYEYAFWKGWRPTFVTTPLWTRTFHRSGYDDILFSPLPAWSELTQLLGVDCSWNVGRPGAREFDTERWHEIGTAVPPPPERKTFALRACRFLFGDEAGPLMAPLWAENISHMFIAKPDEVMKRLTIDDPVATMAGQAEATGRAAASLEGLWKLHERRPVLSDRWYGYFLNWYRFTHGARILARHRTHMLAARRAIREGNRAQVEEHLAAAREHLTGSASHWETVRKRATGADLFRSYLRKTSREGMLFHLDTAALKAEADDLWERREKLIAAHTIPRWFERSCRRRTIVAAPASGPISVDGRLNEAAWAKARPIEHFMDYRALRFEALETRGRLVYDAENLYAAFECFDPSPSEITLAMPDRDEHALCDSIELLVAPGRGSKDFVHWIVDSRGTVFDARASRDPDGRVTYSPKWNGTAQVAVARTTDRWVVEMAVPATDLGVRPREGRSCAALLCRNIVHTRPKGEEEQNAIVFLDGASFHTVSKFAELRFTGAAERPPEARVGLVLQPMTFRHVTTGEGSGTAIGGDLRIETDRYLHDVRVSVSFTDGVRPLGRKHLGGAGLVRLIWRPKEPFFTVIREEVRGVVCTFKVTAREGEWIFVRRFGSPRRASVPHEKLFTEGTSGKALAGPVYFSSVAPETIQLAEGTVEFWTRPRWDVVPRGSGPGWSLEHTFFNMGPIRPDYPYLSNHDSLTISHETYGSLVCILSNSRYESRTVSASIRDWRRGQWHHVAVQWKLDDGGKPAAAGKTSMAIFIDGRLASDRCRGSAKSPNTQPLEMRQLPLPIQIGSMNTGFAGADAAIDELRISSVRRYTGTFTPRERLEPNERTLALFHFDGTLDAAVPRGLKAICGPAQ